MDDTERKDEPQAGRRRWPRWKICLLLALCAAAVVAYNVLRFAPIGERTITVRPLDKLSDTGQGTEIWIKRLLVDGVERPPEEVFSGTWICEDGYYLWRNYDQAEGMTDSLTASFPAGTEVDIVFQSNVWRGIVRVTDGYVIPAPYDVNCWSDNTKDTGEVSYLRARMSPGIIRAIRVVLVYVFIWLAVVCIRAIRRKRRRRAPAGG